MIQDTDALREAETVILFDESRDPATVYTHSKRWINRLTRLGVVPKRHGRHRSGRSWAEFEVPKNWLRLPVNPEKLLRNAPPGGRFGNKSNPVLT